MIRIMLLVFLSMAGASAQWLNYRESGIPRLRDGRPNLSAAAPKGADGKPDLTGLWQVVPTPMDELTRLFGPEAASLDVPGDSLDLFPKYAINALADFPMDQAPITKEAAAIFAGRLKNDGKDNPTGYCAPAGVPLAQLLFLPFKIVHTKREIMILGGDWTTRQIYLDGRSLPADPFPAWMGYSVGRWDGSTLLVETAGFNDKTWLDFLGHPRSEAMRITERYSRRDFGHMDLEYTINDPHNYTKPISFKVALIRVPDTHVMEYVCSENEKDLRHFER